MPTSELNVLWLYPDVLNLHGDRGNLPALIHVGGLLGLKINVSRADDINTPPALDEIDLLFLPAGELKCLPRVIEALSAVREELDAFLARGGLLYASGSSGAVLAEELVRLDGARSAGLDLLPMRCREREAVYGDDLWFRLPDGLELIGCQIQVMDTELIDSTARLGQVIYGHGNHADGSEGARRGNVLFSNCLGPLLVKNPRFAARLLREAAAARSYPPLPALDVATLELEDASFQLIRRFIENKMQENNK